MFLFCAIIFASITRLTTRLPFFIHRLIILALLSLVILGSLTLLFRFRNELLGVFFFNFCSAQFIILIPTLPTTTTSSPASRISCVLNLLLFLLLIFLFRLLFRLLLFRTLLLCLLLSTSARFANLWLRNLRRRDLLGMFSFFLFNFHVSLLFVFALSAVSCLVFLLCLFLFRSLFLLVFLRASRFFFDSRWCLFD